MNKINKSYKKINNYNQWLLIILIIKETNLRH